MEENLTEEQKSIQCRMEHPKKMIAKKQAAIEKCKADIQAAFDENKRLEQEGTLTPEKHDELMELTATIDTQQEEHEDKLAEHQQNLAELEAEFQAAAAN